LRFDFEERTSRLTKKLPPFAIRETALSLSDVADDADRRASELRDKPVELVFRKLRGHVVNRDHNAKRTLERLEILERLCH